MNTRYLVVLLLIASPRLDAMKNDNTMKINNWDAKKYKESSSPQFLAAMEIISKIPFSKTDNVLDIGCGDGKVTSEIVKRVPHGTVKGLDFSINMIEWASKHYSDVPHLSFERADIADYSSEQKFNYALAFSSLAWVKKQQKALVNIANALAPNGQFIAGIAHEDSPYIRARIKIMASKKWGNYFVDYELPFYPLNEDKIKDLCKNAGLTLIDTTRRGCPHTFENREAFIKFMRALPAQLNKIPDELQEEFLNDIIDDYLKDVPQNKTGGIELILSGLVIIAEK